VRGFYDLVAHNLFQIAHRVAWHGAVGFLQYLQVHRARLRHQRHDFAAALAVPIVARVAGAGERLAARLFLAWRFCGISANFLACRISPSREYSRFHAGANSPVARRKIAARLF